MKNLSKKIIIVFAFCMISAFAVLGCSCGLSNKLESVVNKTLCEHVWKITQTQAATCSVQGVEKRTCTSCGAVKTTLLPMVSHTEIIMDDVEATCAHTGSIGGKKCSVCDYVMESPTIIPALEHTLVELPAIEVTCETNGFTGGKKCSVCDLSLSGEVLPALGHSWVENEKTNATCTTDGSITKTCQRCNKTNTETISALGHNYVSDFCTTCDRHITYTDLTGTAWMFNSSVTATAGYGMFSNVEHKLYSSDGTSMVVGNLFVGYVWDQNRENFIEVTNYVSNTFLAPNVVSAGSPEYMSIEFFSGNDCTNPRLIKWIIQNTTFYGSRVRDLTGTTWKINSLDCTAGQAIYNVDFRATIHDDYEINGTDIGIGYAGYRFEEGYTSPTINKLMYGMPFAEYGAIGDTITFTGGTDITNTALINWLYENAILQSNAVTDLTGTTWQFSNSVNATAGYGEFFISYITLNSGEEEYSGSIKVGYSGSFDNNFSTPTANAARLFPLGYEVTDSGMQVLKITGGTDVTNAALIKWLYGNATLLE